MSCSSPRRRRRASTPRVRRRLAALSGSRLAGGSSCRRRLGRRRPSSGAKLRLGCTASPSPTARPRRARRRRRRDRRTAPRAPRRPASSAAALRPPPPRPFSFVRGVARLLEPMRGNDRGRAGRGWSAGRDGSESTRTRDGPSDGAALRTRRRRAPPHRAAGQRVGAAGRASRASCDGANFQARVAHELVDRVVDATHRPARIDEHAAHIMSRAHQRLGEPPPRPRVPMRPVEQAGEAHEVRPHQPRSAPPGLQATRPPTSTTTSAASSDAPRPISGVLVSRHRIGGPPAGLEHERATGAHSASVRDRRGCRKKPCREPSSLFDEVRRRTRAERRRASAQARIRHRRGGGRDAPMQVCAQLARRLRRRSRQGDDLPFVPLGFFVPPAEEGAGASPASRSRAARAPPPAPRAMLRPRNGGDGDGGRCVACDGSALAARARRAPRAPTRAPVHRRTRRPPHPSAAASASAVTQRARDAQRGLADAVFERDSAFASRAQGYPHAPAGDHRRRRARARGRRARRERLRSPRIARNRKIAVPAAAGHRPLLPTRSGADGAPARDAARHRFRTRPTARRQRRGSSAARIFTSLGRRCARFCSRRCARGPLRGPRGARAPRRRPAPRTTRLATPTGGANRR